MSNAGYTNLLAHLQRQTPFAPLPTIQSALAHHLSNSSPLPTPLAASIISSPLFSLLPFSHSKLQTLFTAFRHATHLKYRDLKTADENRSAVGSVFSRGTAARVNQWTAAVLKGLKGGQPILRLACSGGLLAGLEDIKNADKLETGRSQLENEIIISVAESIDVYAHASSGWEAEFRPKGDVDTMTLALILAAQSLTLVVPTKLKALPLSVLADLLVFTVTSAFASGTFLSAASSSKSSTSSPTLRAINESPLMEFIAPLSKLTALTLTIFIESRPAEGMVTAAAALAALQPLSKSLESDWIGGSMAKVLQADDDDTREQATMIWKTLKTLLFSNIMIADAILSAIIYVPPAAYPSATTAVPPALALTVLHTLSDLSFVVSQFGGVTTTASPGFVELKKTFYLALDILSKSREESERFVRQLCASVADWQGRREKEYSDPDVQAKTAYALTCIEQLVPVLSGECIQLYALPLALPHLSDASYRETYESSHSVVLAVFAAHADRHAKSDTEFSGDDTKYSSEGRAGKGKDAPRPFTERMVPFYAHCLIENSIDGRLNTPQLRLAFASLVRSASSSTASSCEGSASTFPTRLGDAYALAWYCIDALLAAIRDAASQGDTERVHRLRLTLISSVPSLPLVLLPRVLEEVKTAILSSEGDARAGRELVEAMYEEISERVGDQEKEVVLRWWYENRRAFGNDLLVGGPEVKEGSGEGEVEVLSRL
ncbi:hypothetical protein R3P38DRAFT_3256846 [Favolaschia claudopus]|uniref:Uncharacterized protein n=1 Tax=Favolaschia claudopus TaxID=2862362 RepID=A0AAW0DAX5_9AGAR